MHIKYDKVRNYSDLCEAINHRVASSIIVIGDPSFDYFRNKNNEMLLIII